MYTMDKIAEFNNCYLSKNNVLNETCWSLATFIFIHSREKVKFSLM